MKSLFHLLLLLKLLLQHFVYGMGQTAQIFSISNRIDKDNYRRASSMGGGTMLYIKGVGLSPMADMNMVMIGTNPCKVKASSEVYIQCFTTGHNKEETLDVTVMVNMKPALCSPNICRVTYANYYTPKLRFILPGAQAPNSRISFEGRLQVGFTTDIEFIKLGQFQCNMLDQPAQKVNYWSTTGKAKCVVSKALAGGLQNTQIKGPNGDTLNAYQSRRYDLHSTIHNFKVVPQINAINSNVGGIMGQLMTIHGVGFSEYKDQVVVTAAGQKCNVLTQTVNKITCSLEANYKNSNVDAFDANLGHSGVVVNTYNITDSNIDTNIAAIRSGANTVTLDSTKTFYDFDILPFYRGLRQIFHMKGYIRANITGNHVFKFMSVPLYAKIYLSNVANNTLDSNLQEILAVTDYTKSWQTFREYDFVSGFTTRSSAISLTAGNYYLIEAYYQNYNNHYHNAFFSLGLETPSFNNLQYNNSISEQQNITLTYTHLQEKMTIKMNNIQSGTYTLMMNGKISQALNWDASESSMKYQLDHRLGAYGDALVVRTGLDTSGAPSTTSPFNGYSYDITFRKHRQTNAGKKPMINGNQLVKSSAGSIQASVTITQAPDNYMTGNYSITWNGVTGIFNFDWNAESVLLGLKKLGLDNTADVKQYGHGIENHYYLVDFNGIKGQQNLFTFDKTNLTCDNTNSISLTTTRSRASSSSLDFSPVSTEFITTPASSTQLNVFINGIKAGCRQGTDCSYVTNAAKVPKITAFSLSGSTLSITLNNPNAALTVAFADMIIHYADTICTPTAFSSNIVTCTLATNTDNTNKIVAGQHWPVIHYKNLGYMEHSTTLAKSTVTPTISSLSQENGSARGGQQVTIVGTNFPFLPNSNSSASLSVTIGGTACPINSFTNQAISIYTPIGSGTAALVVSVNGQTASSTYTYSSATLPTITALDITSASPALKTTLTLTGTNMDTNTANIKATLVNVDPTKPSYPLSVFTASATSLQLIASGGKIGTYNVVVETIGMGAYAASTGSYFQFSYEFKMTGVSPLTGSTEGGTILTITGVNFATVTNQMQVFIGSKSEVCDVLTTTTTQLTCRTRKTTYTTKQVVSLTQRLQDVATCTDSTNNCEYEFTTAATPTITGTPASEIKKYNDLLTFTGASLSPTSGTPQLVLIAGTTRKETNTASASATQLTVNFPAIPAGLYMVNIYIPGKGYAKFTDLTNNPIIQNSLVITGVAPLSGSIGGNTLTVDGSGFDSMSQIVLQQTGQNNYKVCETLTRSNIQITCFFPQFSGSDAAKSTVKILQGTTVETQTTVFEYTNVQSKTLKIQSVNDLTTSPIQITSSGTTFTLKLTSISSTATMDNANLVVSLYSFKNKRSYTGVIAAGATSTVLTATFTEVPLDNYTLRVFTPNDGYAQILNNVDQIHVMTMTPVLDANYAVQSYAGGKVVINANGFDSNTLTNNLVEVCGYKCDVTAATFTQLTCIQQGIINQVINNDYLQKSDGVIKPVAIQTQYDSNIQYLMDNQFEQYYRGYQDQLVFDFGVNMQANLSQIRLFPTMNKNIKDFNHTLIEGSNDNTTFTLIMEMQHDQIRPGWNEWVSNSYDQNVLYRFVRIKFSSSNQYKYLSEVQFVGLIQYEKAGFSITSTQCDLSVKVNGHQQTALSNAIELRQDQTSSLTSISPDMGSTAGNYPLTIGGSGFGTSTSAVVVTIDGVSCAVTAVTNTQITCTVGARPTFVPPKLEVMINNRLAANQGFGFTYIDKWSESTTWGGESPPRLGDSVFIPKGQNVLLDVSPPQLKAVMIEGQLIFKNVDLTLEAEYIVANGGNITIGTPTNRITANIKIVLHGERTGKQLPMFGNKAFIMNRGTLDVHGVKRDKTWTTLASTVNAGSDTITLTDPVDWQVGELVGIATSTYSYNQSECRSILTRVSSTQFKLNQTLDFKHYSETETLDGVAVPMLTEVGLLSRNIKFMGAPGSWESGWGGHLMIHGKQIEGTIARISYAEFFNMGQQQQIGRYSIHFHMCGNMFKSYIEGNAVHHSLARVITVHGTHYLRVTKNVGYFVFGHNYFLEDGIESYNTLDGNLAIKTVELHSLLVSDQTAASFWVTRPNNFIKNNHAAGGDWYGYWYEIHAHPMEENMNPDVCPQGEKILLMKNNVAHGFTKYGLRINKLVSRRQPCMTARKDFPGHVAKEPTEFNPPVLSIFEDFLAFKCRDHGIQAEMMGHTLFRNLKLVENRLSGIIVHKTNLTSPAYPVIIENALIAGHSINNDLGMNAYYPTEPQAGMVLPRTSGLMIKGVTFVNFEKANTECFQTCALCQNGLTSTAGGHTSHIQGVKYVGTINARVNFTSMKNDIIHDVDGTVSMTNAESYITPSLPHMESATGCTKVTTNYNTPVVVCDNTVQIRQVQFFEMGPKNLFIGLPVRIARVDPVTKANITTLPTTSISTIHPHPDLMDDIKGSVVVPIVTKNTYHIVWGNGVDFDKIAFVPKYEWKATDGSTVLRFNHTKKRELYESSIYFGSFINKVNESYRAAPIDRPSNAFANLPLGHMTYDNATQVLDLFVGGNENATSVEVRTVACRTNCPSPGQDCAKDKVERKWSDVANWPLGRLPAAGEDVEIKCPWTMVMDVAETPIFNNILIKGTLKFNQAQPTSILKARSIYVDNGKLLAGTPTAPFTKQLEIQLFGGVNDMGLMVDSYVQAGNKLIVTTGEIGLYGVVPTITKTKLNAFADLGATQIEVVHTTGWTVGSAIVITSTGSSYFEQEYKTITAIAGTTITLDTPLAHDHYGAASRITGMNGDLDMRSTVGLLTRNIKLVGVQDAGPHGMQVLVAGSRIMDPATQKNKIRIGWATLQAVQFINAGQQDSFNAAVNFQYTDLNATIPMTSILHSTFQNSMGMCVYSKFSKNITIVDNIFTECHKYGVAAFETVDLVKINNNLFTGVKIRPSMKQLGKYDYTAGISLENAQNNMQVEVRDNVAQGIEGAAYIINGVDCKEQNKQYFINNTAGSAEGGMIPVNNGTGCYTFGNLFAYRCGTGVISQFTAASLIADKITLAENKLNAKMQFAHETVYDVSQIYTNIHIYALARPNCTKCYKNARECSNIVGTTPSIHQLAGQHINEIMSVRGVQKICTNSVKDTRTLIHNIKYENFKMVYTEPAWAKCSNNIMIHLENIAHDTASQYYLHKSSHVNSDYDSIIKYDNPDKTFDGWLGGCGKFKSCIGTETFYISDMDGNFFGQPGQTVHNNRPYLVEKPKCPKVQKWNGYHCQGLNLRMLLFENRGSDYYTTMYQPYIQSEFMSNSYLTNMFKEWVWVGPTPMDKRKPIFIALVQKNLRHNLTFASGVPGTASFRLQHFPRQLNAPLNYIIIKMQFNDPATVQLKANGTVVEPNLLSAKIDLATQNQTCGAHNYDDSTRILEFVLTAECDLWYEKQTSLKVTMHLTVNIDTFYKNNGLTSFVDKMCAFLGIPTNQLRIANVRSGSVYIDFHVITGNTQSTSSSAQSATLQAMSDKIAAGNKDGSLQVGYPIKDIAQTISVAPTPGGSSNPTNTNTNTNINTNNSNTNNTNNRTLIIVLAVVIPVVVISIIIILVLKYIIHKNNQANLAKIKPVDENDDLFVKNNSQFVKSPQINQEMYIQQTQRSEHKQEPTKKRISFMDGVRNIFSSKSIVVDQLDQLAESKKLNHNNGNISGNENDESLQQPNIFDRGENTMKNQKTKKHEKMF